MAMSPAQRPRGVLGFWSSLMTALGNMEHMPVRLLFTMILLISPQTYATSVDCNFAFMDMLEHAFFVCLTLLLWQIFCYRKLNLTKIKHLGNKKKKRKFFCGGKLK